MITDMENGKVGIIITKDLSRLGRDYLKTGEYIELIFPDYDVRYIAINDNVDTAKSENEMMVFRNVFNDFYAKDTSKKVRAVFRSKDRRESRSALTRHTDTSRIPQTSCNGLWILKQRRQYGSSSSSASTVSAPRRLQRNSPSGRLKILWHMASAMA
jgi:hypothetical protein